MNGVEIIWTRDDRDENVWWCEIKKQLGPAMLSTKRSITGLGAPPSSLQCLNHEDGGLEEMKHMILDVRTRGAA